MTKILFITSTRIGDAVLSTGLIDHLLKTETDPSFTIVCGPLPASLFEGVPHLDRLIVLKKRKYNRHWLNLWKQVKCTKWDIVVDLRNSIVSRVVSSERRYGLGNFSGHKADQNAAALKLAHTPSPRLFLTDAQKDKAEKSVPSGSAVLAVAPTANWIGKTWPADRFIELVRILTSAGDILDGARVAVFAAPGEETEAYQVLNSVPLSKRIDMIAKGDPGEAAAALARCDFFIGNDSGLMHCAAAAGVPTLGLFGASHVEIYGPFGLHASYAHTPESFAELSDFKGYDPKTLRHSLMTSLSVEAVLEAARDLWASMERGGG